MLKYQLDSLEGLDDATKALYTEKDGKFVLEVDGVPKGGEDVTSLKNALAMERDKRKAAVQRAEAAEAAKETEAEEKARKDGDLKALDESWKKKFNKLQEERDEEVGNLRGALDRRTVHQDASDLANKLAVPGSAKALLPHIQPRLKAEMRDGEMVTVVVDEQGKPTAQTLDDLAKEITQDAALAPILVASKAAGGGAEGSRGGAPETKVKADMGGDKNQRVAAIKQRMNAA